MEFVVDLRIEEILHTHHPAFYTYTVRVKCKKDVCFINMNHDPFNPVIYPCQALCLFTGNYCPVKMRYGYSQCNYNYFTTSQEYILNENIPSSREEENLLYEMNYNNFRLTPVKRDSGWTNAKLMAASGQYVYLVRGDELIQMEASTDSVTGDGTVIGPSTTPPQPDDAYIPFEFTIWGPFYGKGKVYKDRVEVDGYVRPGIHLSHEEVRLDGGRIKTSSQDKTTGYKMEAEFWVKGKTLYGNFRAFIPKKCVLGICTPEKTLYRSGDKKLISW